MVVLEKIIITDFIVFAILKEGGIKVYVEDNEIIEVSSDFIFAHHRFSLRFPECAKYHTEWEPEFIVSSKHINIHQTKRYCIKVEKHHIHIVESVELDPVVYPCYEDGCMKATKGDFWSNDGNVHYKKIVRIYQW